MAPRRARDRAGREAGPGAPCGPAAAGTRPRTPSLRPENGTANNIVYVSSAGHAGFTAVFYTLHVCRKYFHKNTH